MNETEKRILLELKRIKEWMKDAVCVELDKNCHCLFDQVFELHRRSGDYCDVFVTLHFTDGHELTVSNECWQSLLRQQYWGAVFHIEDDDPMVVVVFFDKQNRFHQTRIPVSSIVWIDTWSKEVKWMQCYNSTPGEDIKKFDKSVS